MQNTLVETTAARNSLMFLCEHGLNSIPVVLVELLAYMWIFIDSNYDSGSSAHYTC